MTKQNIHNAICARQKMRHACASIIVMTIIVASGIMLVSAEFALFVVGAIRQARAIDHATIAYYAAESGAESGLFQIRKEGRTELRKEKSESSEFPQGMKWTLENDGGTVRFRNSIDKLQKSLMKKNESSEFALYTYSPQGLAGVQGVNSLKVMWDTERNCGESEGQRPWFEISAIEWNEGLIDWGTVYVKKTFLKPDGLLGQAVLDFFSVRKSVENSLPMLVRAKPLFCDLTGVRFTLHSDNAGALMPPIAIPNYFFLSAEGAFSSISQRAEAVFPAKNSALGLFDFTFFSEEQVKKKEQVQ